MLFRVEEGFLFGFQLICGVMEMTLWGRENGEMSEMGADGGGYDSVTEKRIWLSAFPTLLCILILWRVS
jgi:hypothetical protein